MCPVWTVSLEAAEWKQEAGDVGLLVKYLHLTHGSTQEKPSSILLLLFIIRKVKVVLL